MPGEGSQGSSGGADGTLPDGKACNRGCTETTSCIQSVTNFGRLEPDSRSRAGQTDQRLVTISTSPTVTEGMASNGQAVPLVIQASSTADAPLVAFNRGDTQSPSP